MSGGPQPQAVGGLRIGTFAGAPVILDWTVAILAGYILYSDLSRDGMDVLPHSLMFVGILLGSILVHEFAHALAAVLLKLPVRRIMLTLFGGHVEFVRPPQKRWHDIIVSFAGPASNLVLAAAFLAIDLKTTSHQSDGLYFSAFCYQMWVTNLTLGAFNLLPGFPLDGGRILKSLLSYLMRPAHARLIAGVLGLLIALGLVAYGLIYRQLWTAGIGAILVLGAFQEIQFARRQSAASAPALPEA